MSVWYWYAVLLLDFYASWIWILAWVSASEELVEKFQRQYYNGYLMGFI